MRESFLPPLKAGQPLTQSHIDKLNRLARQVATSDFTGNYLVSCVSPANGSQVAPPPPTLIDTHEVIGIQGDDIYRIKRRWFDHDPETWKTDDPQNYQLMDASDVGLSFSVGDIATAFWDPQRAMWIPIGGESTDPMWCGLICECALQRADSSCCVYRGSVKRYKTPDSGAWSLTDLCDPPRIVLPAFIVADCQLAEDESGWVRKMNATVEITWTPSGFSDPITEKLELYEWCCWGAAGCPGVDDTVTVRISHTVPPGDTDPTHQCPEADGIEVQLTYRQKAGEPINNPNCDYDGWYGEFKADVEIPVRLYGIDYTPASNPGGPQNEFGYVRPDWLTGEVTAFFDDLLNPIATPDAYTLTGSGDCIILTDSNGDVVEETVTRYYRLSVNCNTATGKLVEACIQHLYPPGHPIYAAIGTGVLTSATAPLSAMVDAIALQDAEAHVDLREICTNNFISTFDPDFGNSHTSAVLSGNIPDGAFQGTWPDMHTFLGCFDEPKGESCQLAISDWHVNWVDFTAHWTWG